MWHLKAFCSSLSEQQQEWQLNVTSQIQSRTWKWDMIPETLPLSVMLSNLDVTRISTRDVRSYNAADFSSMSKSSALLLVTHSLKVTQILYSLNHFVCKKKKKGIFQILVSRVFGSC